MDFCSLLFIQLFDHHLQHFNYYVIYIFICVIKLLIRVPLSRCIFDSSLLLCYRDSCECNSYRLTCSRGRSLLWTSTEWSWLYTVLIQRETSLLITHSPEWLEDAAHQEIRATLLFYLSLEFTVQIALVAPSHPHLGMSVLLAMQL